MGVPCPRLCIGLSKTVLVCVIACERKSACVVHGLKARERVLTLVCVGHRHGGCGRTAMHRGRRVSGYIFGQQPRRYLWSWHLFCDQCSTGRHLREDKNLKWTVQDVLGAHCAGRPMRCVGYVRTQVTCTPGALPVTVCNDWQLFQLEASFHP